MALYLNIFRQAFLIGIRGFGGPATHLKLFTQRLVNKEKWISQSEFDGLVSLAALLPGPTSSQVGVALGLEAGGLIGAFSFWIGLTLPSITLMFLLSQIHFGNISNNHVIFWILKLTICAVVLNSLRQLAKRFAKTILQKCIVVGTFIYFLFGSSSILQILGLLFCAVIGMLFIKSEPREISLKVHSLGKQTAFIILVLTAFLILISPYLIHNKSLHLFAFGTFLQIGALAFGGGHVVLPLLQSRLVHTHLINVDSFARGYFFAQLMPGPLFTVSMFMGASLLTQPHGFLGGLEALLGIFLPGSFLMLAGTYFWQKWSHNARFTNAIAGVNAGVLGLLLVAAVSILTLH
jgi:chromate transporter